MPLFFLPFLPMLTQQVNAWLTSPDDYAVGLQLLRDTGYTGFTLSILAKGDDTYNRNRLEAELWLWVGRQNNVLPIAAAAAPGTADNSASSPVLVESAKPNQEPASVKTLREGSYELMDERAELKARIRALENDPTAQDARRDAAFRIKAITRQLDEVISQLDFYAEHGYLPTVAADPAIEIDDTAALMNMRSYVSRYRAKLKKKTLTPEQRQSWTVLLEQYEAEKTRLELKLSKTNDSHSTGQQTTDRPNHPPSLSRT